MFHVLSLSRSLSNSLETSLTTIALSCYPWVSGPGIAIDRYAALCSHSRYSHVFRSRVRLTLVFAALACAVRSTNAIIWTYLVGHLLWQVRSSRRSLAACIQDGLIIRFENIRSPGVPALNVFFKRRDPRRNICAGFPVLWHTNFHASKLSSSEPFQCLALLRRECVALLPLSSHSHHVHDDSAICTS
jgi:hypothetical protein